MVIIWSVCLFTFCLFVCLFTFPSGLEASCEHRPCQSCSLFSSQSCWVTWHPGRLVNVGCDMMRCLYRRIRPRERHTVIISVGKREDGVGKKRTQMTQLEIMGWMGFWRTRWLKWAGGAFRKQWLKCKLRVDHSGPCHNHGATDTVECLCLCPPPLPASYPPPLCAPWIQAAWRMRWPSYVMGASFYQGPSSAIPGQCFCFPSAF